MVKYNPKTIQQYANALNRRASIIEIVYFFLGTFFGFSVVPLLAKYVIRVNEGMLAIVIIIFFSIVGLNKGLLLRAEAQRSLCQLEIEKNTRKEEPTKQPA